MGRQATAHALAAAGAAALGVLVASALGLSAVVAPGSQAPVGPDVGGTQVLVVERLGSNEQLLAIPVENGTEVGLEYTHSVEKSRVYDGYTVAGDRLVLSRMEFESYGWGLPSGADVARRNGTFVYDPPGRVTELSVSPGARAGHTLHVGDRTVDLVALADGRSVRLHLDRRSPLDWLR